MNSTEIRALTDEELQSQRNTRGVLGVHGMRVLIDRLFCTIDCLELAVAGKARSPADAAIDARLNERIDNQASIIQDVRVELEIAKAQRDEAKASLRKEENYSSGLSDRAFEAESRLRTILEYAKPPKAKTAKPGFTLTAKMIDQMASGNVSAMPTKRTVCGEEYIPTRRVTPRHLIGLSYQDYGPCGIVVMPY